MLLSFSLETKQTYPTSGTWHFIVFETHARVYSILHSQVTLEEATAKATQMGIMFMETSAKAGHNVKSLFKKIAMSLPGMDKESTAETNTSQSNHSANHSGVNILLIFSEIDVTTPNAEVPEASQCNC